MNKFIDELRRRNVFRVAGVYAVAGWVLAQIATTLEESLGLPIWFDAVIVAVLLLGLPIALIFAWAFELTPEGMVKTEAVSVDQSITAHTGRKLDYAIIGGLVVLAVFLTWEKIQGPVPTAEQAIAVESELAGADAIATSIALRNSIAVLPFDDLSPEGDQEYFSDGIAEEILNVLVGIDGLNVSSRTSSFQFKNRGLGIPEIASELKVRHVVEGSVRKAGNTIRITAQLIDAENDKHLWSETFDRPLSAENIFVIQDEIARSIVAALGDSMGFSTHSDVQVSAVTDNLNAYELFLQARTLFQARLRLDEVEILLARAVELDPEFAKAWEILAALPQLLNDYGYIQTPYEEIIRLTTEFANRSLELDPTRATAIAALAMVRHNAAQNMDERFDLTELAADFERALELEPRNASALTWRGSFDLFVGGVDAALRGYATCIDVDPFYAPCVENHIVILMSLGRDEEALESFRQALNKGLVKLEYAPIHGLARLGEELAFKSSTNHPGVLLGWRRHDELYDAFRNLGADNSELAESILGYDSGFRKIDPYVINSIVIPLGAYDRIPVNFYMWDESHRIYRRSPQFRTYMKQTGVFEYWRENGFPPQCRPVGDDDFECD